MLDWVATVMQARAARRGARIQALWQGYGDVFRVELDGGLAPTAIVKWVRPPAAARATRSDERKRRSYEVELAFYRGLAERCDGTCRVARFYGGRTDAEGWVFVLEDLDAAGYPVRHDEAASSALDACIAWLAAFHARFLGTPPADLWPQGTYWHLATRLEELPAIADRALAASARAVEARLAAARYQTILHGDPKEANFCFGRSSGAPVAAVDFQYTGGGCAMKDLAYLLYGRADEPGPHLDAYFRHLRRALPGRRDLDAIEAEGRTLYPVAELDFCRFLAGWRPDRWRHDHAGQRLARAALAAFTA